MNRDLAVASCLCCAVPTCTSGTGAKVTIVLPNTAIEPVTVNHVLILRFVRSTVLYSVTISLCRCDSVFDTLEIR